MNNVEGLEKKALPGHHTMCSYFLTVVFDARVMKVRFM